MLRIAWITHVGDDAASSFIGHAQPRAARLQVAATEDGLIAPACQRRTWPCMEFIAIARQQQAPAWMAIPSESDQAHELTLSKRNTSLRGNRPTRGHAGRRHADGFVGDCGNGAFQ
jgi:hypothetical protein